MSVITRNDNIEHIKSLITDKYNNIKFIKHNNENNTDFILYFEIKLITIKIFTDFNNYCIIDSNDNISNKYINTYNIKMVFYDKTPIIILDEITKMFINDENVIIDSFVDCFHIFEKYEEFTKFKINYKLLESKYTQLIQNNKIESIKNIPTELLLKPSQISKLLINDIKNVNNNKSYEHYIIPDETNPYILNVKLYFKNIKCYMDIKLNINQKTYPHLPPSLEYIGPKIKFPLLLAIINLNILKIENWSSIITLEYFITKLVEQIEPYIEDNLENNDNFNELEYFLIKLSLINKESDNTIKINILPPIIKNEQNDKTNTNDKQYWKSGTGYGHDRNNTWDIKSYIKTQELQNAELINILDKINKLINDDNIGKILDSTLIKYIINQLNGINMLELNKNKNVYDSIFNILSNLIDKNIGQDNINSIANKINTINDEIDVFLKHNVSEDYNIIKKVCSHFISNQKEIINKTIIDENVETKYCRIMKDLQFGNYEIPKNHRFFESIKNKINQSSVINILSTISSFKKDLPLSWDSSIWVRVSKTNFNIFSFLICGPKNTPYENGLFEFHAYLPPNYPKDVPQVLLHTTGKNTFRFNPNLYNTGKVCLSLLGTWSGQGGENWDSKTSTFLQVLVSIQSLILVDDPYFNEPGYERRMNTPAGKDESSRYNSNIHPHTILFAMVDMIKNKPEGFEEVITNHFALKKDEILAKTLDWEEKCKDAKTKALINKHRTELMTLI